jgi:hypothetical protein
MPFSLIFPPDEMQALRRIAAKEGVPVAALIRRAIHVTIRQSDPDDAATLLMADADSFLDHLATRVSAGSLTPGKRSAFKKHLVRLLS